MKIDGINNIYNTSFGAEQSVKRNPLTKKLPADSFVSSSGGTEKTSKKTFTQVAAEKIKNALSILKFEKPVKAEPVSIPPKGFSTLVARGSYMPSSTVGRSIDVSYVDKELHGDARIKQEFNPGTLEIVDDVDDCLYASNFMQPGGTVAIPSTLGETLATAELMQCTGVAFVDKTHNLQTLLHYAPGVNHADNKALVEYILSYMKPEDTEITIVPGCYLETGATLAALTHVISDVSPDYDIKFMNFPDDDHTTLVLKNGELKCAGKCNPSDENINPAGKIIYAKHEVQRSKN